MTKAYKIDFTTNTVTVTKAFLTAAETNINSTEFQTYQQFKQMGLTIVLKTIKRTNTHRVTYKQMKAYIACVTDGSRYLEELETVRQASLKEANPYQFVCDWFEHTFPNRNAIPELDDMGKITNFADVA